METIYNTPARNTNNNYIEKAIDELKKLFSSVEEYEKEHPGETYGYAGLPYCLDRVREKGIDKIFFVGRDYHGRYEDDDCYFTYWDEDSKEFFNDTWSTRFAAPNYDLYEMPIDFGAGWESGLIDKEAYLQVMKTRHMNILNNTSFDTDKAENYNLRVLVEGGRKFKGEGYLVSVDESSYRFATPMYRTHSSDYGISTTKTAVIWNPVDNTINRANAKYLKFLDEEQIMNEYKVWAKNIIDRARVDNIHSNNQYNLGSYILDIDYSFETFMSTVWMYTHKMFDQEEIMNIAYDKEMEEKKMKESEFRASKMPELIEWVKNNTDKKGEEIIKLAIHIYDKRYN